MSLGRRTVDGMIIAWVRAHQSLEQPTPQSAHRPTSKSIVDGRGRTINRGAILPPAANLEDMNTPADDAPIIGTPRAGLIVRKKRLNHRPLRIAQPKFIRHDPSPPSPIRLESQPDIELNPLIEFAA
jgi:hypothetical protein